MSYLDLVNYGVKQRMPGHAFFRMFSPHGWSANLGRRDLGVEYDGGLKGEMLLI